MSPTERILDIVLTDLRHLLAELGEHGGHMSASAYDTAQILRFSPPPEGVEPAMDWLLAQQQADGGWGNAVVPLSRDVPTLACILAFKTYGTEHKFREAIRAGLSFLQAHAEQWSELPDDIPVGVELIFPRLLEDAVDLGLMNPGLTRNSYQSLFDLRNRRLQAIAAMAMKPGLAPVHSWEGWGTDPDPTLVDGSGGLGSSPAATAAWIHAASRRPELAQARMAARSFLNEAAAATHLDIPGIAPTVWPITHFERSWGLYALERTGWMSHPELEGVVRRQLAALAASFRPSGIGMNDDFTEDGDTTSIASALLSSPPYNVNASAVQRFQRDDLFFTYPGEMRPSLSTTAHAVLAGVRGGAGVARSRRYLVARQANDGRWLRDKWHASWLYATSEVVTALAAAGETNAIASAVDALLKYQNEDGGWGVGSRATGSDTGYAVHALHAARKNEYRSLELNSSLRRAGRWLLSHYRPFGVHAEHLWIGKELYSPYRIEKIFELTAILSAMDDPGRDGWTGPPKLQSGSI